MSKIIDHNELIPTTLIINAVETDDEVGASLRFHLLMERLLIVFLESKIADNKLDKIHRQFGQKLEQSEKLGLLKEICNAIRCVNDIRNSISHIIDGKFIDSIDEHLLNELKKQVENLEWVKQLGGLKIIKLKIPSKFGERVIMINESKITDLTILAMSILSEMTRYIKSLKSLDYSTLK